MGVRATTRLRQLLASQRLAIAPGAYDCLIAKVIEGVGFPLVYMTGGGSALARLGKADVGFMSMTDMVRNAAAIAEAVTIPVIADADTGYGNAINVRRTVREFERAGVAAIHLEDQEWPKRCGHFEGKRLISREEMVQKVRAAVDARLDDDFVIIARTDAIAVEGFEVALERAAAYAEAGADMLFVEAPRTLEQIRVVAEQLPVPLLFNMGDSGKTPNVSAAELERWGYRVMIIPGTHRIVIPAVRRYLEHLRETGDIGQNPCERMPWDEWQAFVGLPEIEALERRYAG